MTELLARLRPEAVLAAGGASCLMSAALLFTGERTAPHLLGYLLGSVLPIAAVSWFRRLSIAREASRGLVTSRGANAMAIALLTVSFLLTVLHSYLLARAILVAKDY